MVCPPTNGTSPPMAIVCAVTIGVISAIAAVLVAISPCNVVISPSIPERLASIDVIAFLFCSNRLSTLTQPLLVRGFRISS